MNEHPQTISHESFGKAVTALEEARVRVSGYSLEERAQLEPDTHPAKRRAARTEISSC